MLPGFRFLLAAIVLSLSILIFGLGAAALLRAAHEEFASSPSWHARPETTFAQTEATRPEAARRVLAMLRVDTPIAEKSSEAVLAAVAPLTPADQAPTILAPAEPERIAALKPDDSSLPEPATPEIPALESPVKSEAAPALTDAPAPADETRIAATEEAVPPANEATPTAAATTSAAASPDADVASTKIATLGGPPVTIEAQPPGKAAGAKPDTSAVQKRLQARRAAQRRRMAARARLARQALLQQQIPNPFPFAPPVIQPATQPTVR